MKTNRARRLYLLCALWLLSLPLVPVLQFFAFLKARPAYLNHVYKTPYVSRANARLFSR